VTDAAEFDLDATLAKFAPGTSWRSNSLGHSLKGDLVHVRGVVDGDRIVYRWWRYGRNRWQSEVESAWMFWYLDTTGDMRKG